MPTQIARHDLQWCLRRAPRDLLIAMKKHGANLMVAGGYVRSCVSNEEVNDIDLFCPSKELARGIALQLVAGDDKRIWETDNALTLKGFDLPIQIIHRWTFESAEKAIESFDFTIARAAFWFQLNADPAVHGEWRSICDPAFYQDLAGKRLIYCCPQRNEDAGGSLLRVLKFYQRGYRIPLDSMGAVIGRLVSGVRFDEITRNFPPQQLEHEIARVVTGLLREVDPNLDPRHVAHLPAESVQPGQTGLEEQLP